MLPHVVIHNEMSLDARMDRLEVDMGRFYSLAGTWHEDCTLVGSETLLAGMPELGSAGEAVALQPAESGGEPAATGGSEDSRPLLAAVDSRGRLPGLGQLRGQPYWRDVVALCSAATPPTHLEILAADGVQTIVAGDQRVDLAAALERLAAGFGVRTVRVDAGGHLVGALLRARLVNEISLVVEPRLVGGESPRWLVQAADAGSGDVVGLELQSVERFDDGALWLRYGVVAES
jgi:2,5-diamino-6-(ribosylamino)-4(3H)-pyrimidinone 5'-phosphate reductase